MRTSFTIALLFLGVRLFAQTNLEGIISEGIALHDKGDYKGAIAKYHQALKLDPASAMAHYELAFSHHLDKDYDSALHHAGVVIDGNNGRLGVQAAIVKGSVLDDMGNTKGSIEFYKDVLKQHPDEYLLLYNYAVSCGRLQQWEEAEAALERALRNKISHPSSHLKLAYIKADKGEKVRAVYELYFFLLLENNSPRAKEALAKLRELLYGEAKVESVSVNDKTGDKQININIAVSSSDDPQITAAEIGLATITSASLELNKEQSEEEKLIHDTQTLFSMLGELKENKKSTKGKKSKKKQADPSEQDLFWDFYVPFFFDLKNSDHTQAYCYHILQASGEDDVKAWTEANKSKLEFFYLWVNNH
jgi:tetratricopeptide (TPR) repeat protein